MGAPKSVLFQEQHSHVFLGEGHSRAERQAWAVIWLCGVMMALEVVGGILFGSVALIADGLHMSTHASALLLAALAYSYARRHAGDRRFTFGTGKLGDLAGFTSAVILAMIAVLIGYEAVSRFIHPVPIHFREAIPIAALALAVNLTSAWLLSRGGHHHHHHPHGHANDSHATEDSHRIATAAGPLNLSVFETDHPPVFRLWCEAGELPDAARIELETVRADGSRQVFAFENRGGYLESTHDIPEPHEFTAILRIAGEERIAAFEEHEHDVAHGRAGHAHGSAAASRDNNMRAAIIHVAADAAVSVLVIVGLSLARVFGWLWMDPLAGTVGALVIASWSFGLIRDTAGVLLDMNPDQALEESIHGAVAAQGDRLTDLHVWRLGPGHLGAIVAVETSHARSPEFYREKLRHLPMLSHVTVEIHQAA
ncbi:MAG TPA: CDF family Co(II)/Ni(II) efflux transporter DmeF [Steroidobacteraceae bacterium]|nr:CDF family Co(II)/Ni(II) efflux transporter DmeF [Steroidobacteraceae bacterium]